MRPEELVRLRYKMAKAIRDCGSHYDETPWDQLPEDRKAGWLGDADRALAAIKAEGFHIIAFTGRSKAYNGKKAAGELSGNSGELNNAHNQDTL